MSQACGPCWAPVSPTPAQTPCGVHTERHLRTPGLHVHCGGSPSEPPHAGRKEHRYPTTTLGARQAAQAEATARIYSQKTPISPSSPRKGRVTSVIHLGCQQAQYFAPHIPPGKALASLLSFCLTQGPHIGLVSETQLGEWHPHLQGLLRGAITMHTSQGRAQTRLQEHG